MYLYSIIAFCTISICRPVPLYANSDNNGNAYHYEWISATEDGALRRKKSGRPQQKQLNTKKQKTKGDPKAEGNKIGKSCNNTKKEHSTKPVKKDGQKRKGSSVKPVVGPKMKSKHKAKSCSIKITNGCITAMIAWLSKHHDELVKEMKETQKKKMMEANKARLRALTPISCRHASVV